MNDVELTESKVHFSLIKTTIAGFFMGLANLVPGVSGGTMILALGLYEDFIECFSEITRFRFSKRALKLVVVLFTVSITTIFVFAGIIQFFMENHLSEMLSLFIGLTLGGVPMLCKKIKPVGVVPVIFTVIGIIIMALVAFVLKPGGMNHSIVLFFVGGFIGSAAMILPGISGSYLLLVMGLYLPILTAINDFKFAIKIKSVEMMISCGLEILLPFGIGLVFGIVFLSNLLKFLMEKRPVPTMALLLGILLGSVLGLYPFKVSDFSRLVKYAVPVSKDKAELKVMAFGLSKEKDSGVYSRLKEIESDAVTLNLVSEVTGRIPNLGDVENARREKMVLIAFDQNVSREVRDNAKDKNLGKVPLVMVPDTKLSVLRVIFSIFLIMTGFILTVFLGRLKDKEEDTVDDLRRVSSAG